MYSDQLLEAAAAAASDQHIRLQAVNPEQQSEINQVHQIQLTNESLQAVTAEPQSGINQVQQIQLQTVNNDSQIQQIHFTDSKPQHLQLTDASQLVGSAVQQPVSTLKLENGSNQASQQFITFHLNSQGQVIQTLNPNQGQLFHMLHITML